MPPKKKLVLFDLDNTVSKTKKYSDIVLNSTSTDFPEDLIVEGAIELLKGLKNSNTEDVEVSIGFITHSSGYDYPPKVALYNLLNAHNVKIDAYISLNELAKYPPIKRLTNPNWYSKENYTNLLDLIEQKYGKPETYMFRAAIKEMNWDGLDLKEIDMVMIGDQWSDIHFANKIKETFGVNIKSIHIDIGDHLTERMLDDLSKYPADANVKTMEELGKKLEEFLNIDLAPKKGAIKIGDATIYPKNFWPPRIKEYYIDSLGR